MTDYQGAACPMVGLGRRPRFRLRVFVPIAVVLLVAAACRPLVADPLEVLPIGDAALGRSNEVGQAAGFLYDPTPGAERMTAMVADLASGQTIPLPDLGRARFNFSVDVSDAGVLVGMVSGDEGAEAAMWDPATGYQLEFVPDLGGSSAAQAINEHGVVAGGSAGPVGEPERAFTFDPVSGEVTDLGTLGGASSMAFDLTDTGMVVGRADRADGETRGFVYDPGVGTMVELAAPPGYPWAGATSINSTAALVVGDAYSDTEFAVGSETALAGVAVVYDLRTGETIALDPFGGQRSSATDVNDRGVVTGTSRDLSGQDRGFAYDTRSKKLVDLGTITGNVSSVTITETLQIAGSETEFVSGVVSFTPFVTLLRTVPDSPPAPAVAGCIDQVEVAWEAPGFDGNEPVSGFVVRRNGETIGEVGPAALGFTDSPVAAGSHEYTVVAVNTLGRSGPSEQTAFVVLPCDGL